MVGVQRFPVGAVRRAWMRKAEAGDRRRLELVRNGSLRVTGKRNGRYCGEGG